jgi:hypothetical protein
LLLVAGCAAADGAGEWQGTRETLPNRAVRVTNSAQGVWPRAQVPPRDDAVRWKVFEPEATLLGTVEVPQQK